MNTQLNLEMQTVITEHECFQNIYWVKTVRSAVPALEDSNWTEHNPNDKKLLFLNIAYFIGYALISSYI
jgi:hypothetical protein